MPRGSVSRVLFDQNVPKRLRAFLAGHTVQTAYDLGWSDLSNGDLLRQAEAAGLEVVVTCDQNLRYQQNLSGRKFAVVVIGTNLWPVIAADPGRVLRAVDAAAPGTVSVVSYSKP